MGPLDAFDRAGADAFAAAIQWDLGRLEAAEPFAARAVRGFGEGPYRRGQIRAELLLAEVQVRVGEPQGLTLAHHAIEEVRGLRSVIVRREQLIPLIAALEARPGTDTRELARIARHIATNRT